MPWLLEPQRECLAPHLHSGRQLSHYPDSWHEAFLIREGVQWLGRPKKGKMQVFNPGGLKHGKVDFMEHLLPSE